MLQGFIFISLLSEKTNNDISEMQIIGRKEIVDLPEWNLSGLTAKIDTGAYTSSIHCHDIEVIEEKGNRYLQFHVLDPAHPEYKGRPFRASRFALKSIRSSNGESEERYVIDSELRIGGVKYKCRFSLADRSKMRYSVLIGRKFIKRKFFVDVSKVNILSRKAT